MENPIRGTVAGLVATVPMTAVMLAIHRRLPLRDQHATPPRQITMEAAEAVDLKERLSESAQRGLTAVSHFGYGAAMGTIYGAVLADRPAPPLAKGIGFGLGVWAASYLGWLPAVGSRAGAERQGLNRNAMMVAGHVVWGIGLSLIFERLRRRQVARARTRNAARHAAGERADDREE